MSSVSSANGAKHTCQLCGYKTLQKTQLKLHKQAVHDGGKLQCPGCDHQFCSKGALANHHIIIIVYLRTQLHGTATV